MPSFRIHLLFVIQCIFLAACSPDDRSAIDAYADLQRAECEFYARCIIDYHGSSASYVAAGVACDLSRLAISNDRFETILERGLVGVDDERLARCREDLAACRDESPNCDRIFLGTQPEGAACIDYLECESARCSGSQYSATCGVCEPADSELAAVGEPCAWSNGCAQVPGATVVCSESATGDGVCTLRYFVGRGESCAADEAACDRGLVCSRAGTCVSPLPVGAPCVAGDYCVRSAYCSANEFETTSAEGTCFAVVLQQEGESCGAGPETAGRYEYCDSRDDLLCDGGTARCVRVSRRALGESCAMPSDCGDELVCVDGVCQAPLPVGERCLYDGQCESRRCESVPNSGTFESRCGEPLPICE